MSHYFPCVRSLRSTPCQVERNGVGKGGERGQEQRQEMRGKAGGGAERGRKRRKRRQVRAGRAAGSGVKKVFVGGGCVVVPGVLRGGR